MLRDIKGKTKVAAEGEAGGPPRIASTPSGQPLLVDGVQRRQLEALERQHVLLSTRTMPGVLAKRGATQEKQVRHVAKALRQPELDATRRRNASDPVILRHEDEALVRDRKSVV
jgi:hypothetical protein